MFSRSIGLLALLLAPALTVSTFAATPDELLRTVREEFAATACDCGCGMTVLKCLHDDQSCARSPQIAREILGRKLSSGRQRSR